VHLESILAENLITLTSSLYRFVQATEEMQRSLKSVAGTQLKEDLKARAHDLAQRFAEARSKASEKMAKAIDEVVANLREFKDELADRTPRMARFRARWKELGTSYESLVAHIKEVRMPIPQGIRLEHLKPRNIARNIFHIFMGLSGVIAYELWLSKTETLIVAGALLAFLTLLDLLRRVSGTFNEQLVNRIFSKISRPHEAHQIPAANWYALAIVLAIWWFPKHAVELGILTLAVGDPVASFAGKSWGARKIYREKSYAGFMGFVLVTWLAASVFMVWAANATALVAIGVGAIVAVTGAITECFSGRIDDNFTIPLAVGAVATLLV
jgi:dolichol kinase